MKICKDCQKSKELTEYYGHQNDCKDCYRARVKSQKDRLGKPRVCAECKKTFKALASEIRRGGGLTCSRKCYYQRLKKIVKRGAESPNWKGAAVGYAGVHDWVRKNAGSPRYCEFCKTTTSKLYDWSNKSGEYQRDLSDWQRLCRRCHIAYDDHPTTRKKTMIERYGHFDPNKFKKG